MTYDGHVATVGRTGYENFNGYAAFTRSPRDPAVPSQHHRYSRAQIQQNIDRSRTLMRIYNVRESSNLASRRAPQRRVSDPVRYREMTHHFLVIYRRFQLSTHTQDTQTVPHRPHLIIHSMQHAPPTSIWQARLQQAEMMSIGRPELLQGCEECIWATYTRSDAVQAPDRPAELTIHG